MIQLDTMLKYEPLLFSQPLLTTDPDFIMQHYFFNDPFIEQQVQWNLKYTADFFQNLNQSYVLLGIPLEIPLGIPLGVPLGVPCFNFESTTFDILDLTFNSSLYSLGNTTKVKNYKGPSLTDYFLSSKKSKPIQQTLLSNTKPVLFKRSIIPKECSNCGK